ncbi:mechanosensitive ion channel [Rhizobium sp. CB3090]|uniref:mechanosensitive ion channel family protein n=1 Tax=Rhizobium sp. CB3090 TaxID=3039156 RepID=UPI0024B0637E|nr:mechanosensitive ion channel domain-containing protein [Rhizobium sp. CB3090]WFU10485.1 mechanosensitive ion channel [Rhizobium sp. CB3090]
MFRGLIPAAFVLLFVAIAPQLCQAQVAETTPAAPPAKVSELLRLMNDPELRQWLEKRQAAEQPAAATATATLIETGEARTRARYQALRAAIPNVTVQLTDATRRVREQARENGFAPAFVMLTALICVGLVGEWFFKKAVLKARFQNPLVAHTIGGFGPWITFTLVSSAIFLAIDWPPLLHVVVLFYLLAFIAARLVFAFCKLSRDAGALSPFSYRRACLFIAVLAIAGATTSLTEPLSIDRDVGTVISHGFSILLLLIALEAVWRRPGHATAARQLALMNTLYSVYAICLWLLWVANFLGLFWLGVYAVILPGLLSAVGRTAEAFAKGRWPGDNKNSARMVLAVRGARAIVIAAAVAWITVIWHYDPNILARENPAIDAAVRGALKSVVILILADLCWQLSKAFIDERLSVADHDASSLSAEAARAGRLRTLLPIFRNALAAIVIAAAVLTVLSEMGVQIGPLIAGAGIFGVAIGFGSQTLVKDIVSGIFYLMDDAFRVGEYIQSGSYKGTVESFSLRSVRLRHHRGPVFTVPFGELGAVQNMSRDWAIDKFLLRVPFNTDVAKAKKIAKQIGEQLKEDPEIGPQILETLKMKGVEQIGDFGIELSFAFTVLPGRQTYIRRQAYTMIRDAFMENGIEFAQPTVQVGGEEKSDVAAAALTMHKKRTAEQMPQSPAPPT